VKLKKVFKLSSLPMLNNVRKNKKYLKIDSGPNYITVIIFIFIKACLFQDHFKFIHEVSSIRA